MKNRTLENKPVKLTKENLEQVDSFDQLLNLRYGKEGTELRNEFDAKVEALIWAKKLKELRKETSLSQQALAEKTGLKKSFISRVENGKVDIQLSTFLKILQGLGKSIQFA
jgi:HTH-type transcriptional regulator/antitoxin HipB